MGTWKAVETSTPIWVLSIPKRHARRLIWLTGSWTSSLKRGRLTDFSIERLVGFLLLLGHNVQITVTPKPHSSRKPPTLEVNAMGAVAAARR
jgi:hypothetical protein